MPLNNSGEFDDVTDNSYLSGTVSVGTSEVQAKVGGSNLTNREIIYIENKGSGSIFYGPTGVTTTTGAELAKSQFVFLPCGENQSVFMISSSGTNTVIVQEFA